jgi:hypothetical protein
MTVGWHLLFLSIINITYNINIHQTQLFGLPIMAYIFFSEERNYSYNYLHDFVKFSSFFSYPFNNFKATNNSRDSVLKEGVE